MKEESKRERESNYQYCTDRMLISSLTKGIHYGIWTSRQSSMSLSVEEGFWSKSNDQETTEKRKERRKHERKSHHRFGIGGRLGERRGKQDRRGAINYMMASRRIFENLTKIIPQGLWTIGYG